MTDYSSYTIIDLLCLIKYSICSSYSQFIMLAHYVLHDNKMLCYLKHALYKLEKIKIAFEQY